MSIRVTATLFALVFAACSSTGGSDEDSSDVRWAEPLSPLTQQRLETRIENIRYQSNHTLLTNLERIVAYGEVAIPFCLEGLKSEDPMTRMGTAYCLGRIGDQRVIPEMEPLLDDDVAIVRYEVASRLGDLGSRKGYSVLVDGLEDGNIRNRFNCFRALSELTGRDFGYKHNDPPELREVAARRWREWLEAVESERL